MGTDVQVNGVFCKMFVEKSLLNYIFYGKNKIKMATYLLIFYKKYNLIETFCKMFVESLN